MSTDLETLLTLAAAGNLPATTDYLMLLPHELRADAIEIVQSGIPKPQTIKLRYDWSLHAHDSQLPPEEDWDTWLILAGRGFGKTRTGVEWVRAQVQDRHAHRIVVEDNAGGQMAESTIQNAVERTISVKTLHARRGKYVRAEPVASLYEQSLPRTLIRGPRPPRRPIPRPRRPDVYLDRRPRPLPLP